MIEAIGAYSEAIKGIVVTISPTKTVEIRFDGSCGSLADGLRYRVTAEFSVRYDKANGSRFCAHPLAIVGASEHDRDRARYRGVIRVNESAGGMREQRGGEILFYRGDALRDDLREVKLDTTSGWVTITVPKSVSAYTYKAGDLLYIDGRVYHKTRDVGGLTTYELCVRAEVCHKIDGTEFWDRVRAAHYRAYAAGKK
jgi:hypothetical protein